MLYGYPVEATAENWLHDCIDTVLRKIHADVAAGSALTAWPDCLPVACRDQLQARHGLRDRLQNYSAAFAGLLPAGRVQVDHALLQQNDIAGLLSGQCNCETLADLPESIRASLLELFSFCFGLLTELGVRDRHYRMIWQMRPQHICPFCGLEFFSAPGEPREDQDHFLARSIYPCAAANLRNLVPMGMKCNQRYKLRENVLVGETGLRRRIFNPYNHTILAVSLDRSQPFAAADGRTPLWVVDFLPASEESESWDQIFRIRDRYQRDVLDPEFIEWLRHLRPWWVREVLVKPVTPQVLVDGLGRYISHLKDMQMTGRDFLRVPMFEMLAKHCAAGHPRLVEFLSTVVSS